MRLSAARLLPFLSLSAIPFARANDHHHHRQLIASASGVTSSAAPSAPSAPSAASGASVPPGSSASVSGTLLPTPTGPTPSFSLASQNPTAVPISAIVVNAPSAATSLMPSPFPAGTKPSNIPNAPGLPDREHFSFFSEKV